MTGVKCQRKCSKQKAQLRGWETKKEGRLEGEACPIWLTAPRAPTLPIRWKINPEEVKELPFPAAPLGEWESCTRIRSCQPRGGWRQGGSAGETGGKEVSKSEYTDGTEASSSSPLLDPKYKEYRVALPICAVHFSMANNCFKASSRLRISPQLPISG